jgi:WD40 repeat protein
MDTEEVIGQPLTGHSSLVKTIAFSPAGSTLASGGFDSMIMLWDVTTGQPIGQPIAGHTGGIYSMAFRPNSNTLASGSIDNRIILWDLNSERWTAELCQRVGRNFTQSEWLQNFGSQPYPDENLTCPQWPSNNE